MILGGLQKISLIDYPGKIACTVFTVGCNFRCPWCYARELVLPEEIKKQPILEEEDFFNFLKERKGLLDGVVICGGEPTLHPDLPQFCEKIKNLGFLVKLDTNGSNPKVVRNLIDKNLIDFVAMDIKAPSKEKYERNAGVKIDFEKIKESVNLLKQGRIDYEFRTTVVPTLHTREDIIEIAKWISGAKHYSLQKFDPKKAPIDPKFGKIKSYPESFFLEIKKEISRFFEKCEIKGF